jgi:hypothetical protein
MIASIDSKEWLQSVEREYLTDYIRSGGTSIKFAVPLDEKIRADVFGGITSVAEQSGYLSVRIDSADTKVHMIDEMYFTVAQQIPWRELSRRVITKLAAEAGYSWLSDPNPEEPLFTQLARENHVEPQMVQLDLRKSIGTRVFKQHELAKDFRTAMTHLCLAELSGGPDGMTTSKVLIEWLTGENKSIGPLKQYQIFRKINRASARYFLESAFQWVGFSGLPGVVVALDLARVTMTQNPHDRSVFYSRAAVLDCYEVLREFIDRAENMKRCLILVVPDKAFLEDRSRGMSAYEALKFRVFDEVRDKRLVNPMASLVRLS